MSRKLTHERVSTDGPSKALKTTTFSETVSPTSLGVQLAHRASKHTPPTLPAVPGGEPPAHPHWPEPSGENETPSHRSRRGHRRRRPPPPRPSSYTSPSVDDVAILEPELIWRVVRREEPVRGEADLRLLKTEAPAVCLEGGVQWPSPAGMDPEPWPTLRRLLEQQRDLISTRKDRWRR